MITVVKAPPLATIQDLGRTGYMDSGVPISGVADRDSAILLNALLGNDPKSAMIEWAISGGVIHFAQSCVIAVGGAVAECSVNGQNVSPHVARYISAGDELRVARIVSGRFLLVAVRGGIDVPIVMGSRSTLTSALVGGLQGRRLQRGDVLPIGPEPRLPIQSVARQTHAKRSSGPIHLMRGPQAALFADTAWATFLATDFTISRASDRTGYRLEGAEIVHNASATLPSEPTCLGAVQIPSGGGPIVILNDGPTVGGYPKIAVIRSYCLSQFAQLTPGDTVRFILDDD